MLFSCDKKLIQKSLIEKDIEVNWYHYSYITSGSPDYIEVVKNDSVVLILESIYGLQDVDIKNDTIIITHWKFQTPNKTQRKVPIFNYIIKYVEEDSYDSYQRYLKEKDSIVVK